MALTRSSTDKVISGICGGIARQTGIPSSAVRLIAIILAFTPIPIIVIYLVLAWTLPLE